MFPKFSQSANRSVSVLITLIVSAMLFACGPNGLALGQSSKMSSSVSAQSPTELIAQLQQAKALDESSAKDPTVSLPRTGDFLNHATEAGLAISDLQQGFPASQDRVSYALEVPPKHLAPEQKAALIQQLEDAIRTDNRREQAIVSFSTNIYYQDPNAPYKFRAQEELALDEIKELNEGNHVSWDKVQRALYVPSE